MNVSGAERRIRTLALDAQGIVTLIAHSKTLGRTELTNTVAVIVGTRPGIIKMSPLVQEMQLRQHSFVLIHTGQHYSYSMDRQFFQELDLPDANYQLRRCAKGSLHGEQTAQMLRGTERALLEAKPKVVLVCGDANTNLAAALAARKLQMMIGHVESGLRSFDWSTPEEHNRVMIDHISDFLFAPTEDARVHLVQERVRGRVVVTGNTIVDAIEHNLVLAERKSTILRRLGLQDVTYILATVHREENVDDLEKLTRIVEILVKLARTFCMPVFFPVHPRTADRLQAFALLQELSDSPGIRLLAPLGYLDFLVLMSNAEVIVTDSGGIQEEACCLRIPCVTLRDNTERPETVAVGANVVAGLDVVVVLSAISKMLQCSRNWPNPYGDGNARRKIIDTVLEAM